MPRNAPRFGDIWHAKGGVYGPEPVMVVSSAEFGRLTPDNIVAVPVIRLDDPWPKPHPLVAESIPGVGIAALIRFTTIPKGWLIDEEPFARLDTARHAAVGRRVRALIGP